MASRKSALLFSVLLLPGISTSQSLQVSRHRSVTASNARQSGKILQLLTAAPVGSDNQSVGDYNQAID